MEDAHSHSVARGEGDAPAVASIALEIPVEWMRFCGVCGEQMRFIADRQTRFGLLGNCAHCGEESFAPFTRAVGEAA